MDLYSPVTALPGIGPARAKQLAALGIESVYDLIAYFPLRGPNQAGSYLRTGARRSGLL